MERIEAKLKLKEEKRKKDEEERRKKEQEAAAKVAEKEARLREKAAAEEKTRRQAAREEAKRASYGPGVPAKVACVRCESLKIKCELATKGRGSSCIECRVARVRCERSGKDQDIAQGKRASARKTSKAVASGKKGEEIDVDEEEDSEEEAEMSDEEEGISDEVEGDGNKDEGRADDGKEGKIAGDGDEEEENDEDKVEAMEVEMEMGVGQKGTAKATEDVEMTNNEVRRGRKEGGSGGISTASMSGVRSGEQALRRVVANVAAATARFDKVAANAVEVTRVSREEARSTRMAIEGMRKELRDGLRGIGDILRQLPEEMAALRAGRNVAREATSRSGEAVDVEMDGRGHVA